MPRPLERLTKEQRRSVARATQLIRDAGWREKARKVEDALEEGEVALDPNLPATTDGETSGGQFRLNPRLKLTKGTPPAPLERSDPDLIRLASLLVYLADLALGHTPAQALTDVKRFGRKVVDDKDKLFDDATAPQREAAAGAGADVEKDAQKRLDGLAKDPPPPPPKKIKVELRLGGVEFRLEGTGELDAPVSPPPVRSPVERRMDEVAGALDRYRQCTGSFPEGDNAAMVRALRELDPSAFRADELDDSGQALDPWGRPYVYRYPGELFPGEFDLYSLGPSGEDTILCELHRW